MIPSYYYGYVCIYFLTLILSYTSAFAKAGQSTAREDRVWKAKMSVCESSVCSHLLRDETMNCVNNCTSPVCYADVYGREPLEDGEIDYNRDRKFKNCMRKEIKANNIAERNKKRGAELGEKQITPDGEVLPLDAGDQTLDISTEQSVSDAEKD